MFELFDPKEDVCLRNGANLPHWYQPGVTYFVTFRTEDSIPSNVARTWYRRRQDWFVRHSINPSNWKDELPRLPRDVQREFHETFSREFLDHLDRGHGECVLRRSELATIVSSSLTHFDGERYHLGDFVVMPNHVHLLVCLLGTTEIEAQCYSWKKVSAVQINRSVGRRGRFWQEESFDHLIRSDTQFAAVQRYIAANPYHAKLPDGQYLYYQRRK